MNNFIKFYIIISTLIGLNSSFLIKIKIDKSGLKSEPKIFHGTADGGKFLLKITKKSYNGEWEYFPLSKVTDKNDYAELYVPQIWENLDLAIKVEMVDNKSVLSINEFFYNSILNITKLKVNITSLKQIKLFGPGHFRVIFHIYPFSIFRSKNA